MFFSNNVGRQMKQHLGEEVDMPWIGDLSKYLRFPILHNRPSHNTFQFIIDKVH